MHGTASRGPAKNRVRQFLVCLLIALPASGFSAEPVPAAGAEDRLEQQALSPMPLALSQNAVAQLQIAARTRLYSFAGEQRDNGSGSSNAASAGSASNSTNSNLQLREVFEFDADNGRWQRLPAIPGVARSGMSAIGFGRHVFLFGGARRHNDGTLDVLDEVWRFDPLQLQYDPMPALPVPVTDALVLAFGNRYLAVIGGRSETGLQASVQIFDTVAETWIAAPDWPGRALAGHSGAITGDEALICGGVFERPGTRTLAINEQCWRGRFSARTPAQIDWQPVEAPLAVMRYRAVAAAFPASPGKGGQIIFAHGSMRPYRDDLRTQDDAPVRVVDEVWSYDLAQRQWRRVGRLPVAGLEHRGLLRVADGLLTIGGVQADGQSVKVVRRFTLKAALAEN